MVETMTTDPRVRIQIEAMTAGMQSMIPAMERMGTALRKLVRPLVRLGWSAGDHHIDRICQEILHGVPGRDPALRLQCAVLFAEVLDKGER
jgi:hypothetical protein